MKVALFANTDWYLYNFRLPLARALRERGDQVLLVSPPGRYAELMQQAGFQWQAFSLERKGANPLIEMGTIARFWRLLRQEKPDLLHNFTIKPVLYGSLAARLAGVGRVVNAVPGLGFAFSEGQPLLRAIVSGLYRISLGKSIAIFQNPDDQAVFIENRLIHPAQTRLIPGSGVDTQVFVPTPEPAGDPVALFAGRFLRSKGVAEFVEAARRLRAQCIPARFALVGGVYPDNPESITEQELAAWQAEGAIEYWGWRDDMHNVIPQTALVCLPTAYKEGLPRSLLEAGACSRPAITTDIPGCRLVARPGENALVVAPHDVGSLSKALQTLLTDRALRARLGQRGREIVEKEFSVEIIIAQTLRVYEELDA